MPFSGTMSLPGVVPALVGRTAAAGCDRPALQSGSMRGTPILSRPIWAVLPSIFHSWWAGLLRLRQPDTGKNGRSACPVSAVRTAKGRKRAEKAAAPSRGSGPRRRRTLLCRVPVPGRSPNNPEVDIWLNARPRARCPERTIRSEAWPQEKQYERDETERQQSLKALFANPQHGPGPPINASRLQQFLPSIIERKSLGSIDARLTKSRFRQTFYRCLANF
jgi:hypothetical protein